MADVRADGKQLRHEHPDVAEGNHTKGTLTVP